MKIKIIAPILLFILLITSVVSAAESRGDIAKRNHPPELGGTIGIVWLDDIEPSIHSSQNVNAAVKAVQSRCNPVWRAIDAQDDFIRFLHENPNIDGDNLIKAREFAKYSGYTYILSFYHITSNIQGTNFVSNYGNAKLTDVSLSISMELSDENGWVRVGGASSHKNNQTKSLIEIYNDLIPEIVRMAMYEMRGYFNPPASQNRVGEHTGQIPGL